MATATTTISIFPILLICCIAVHHSGAQAQQPPAVLDIDGKPVRTGSKYYILPLIRGRGGGLTLSASGNETQCPLSVAQARNEVDRGLPVTFSSVDGAAVVRESTDQNVQFSGAGAVCGSAVWKLGSYDESVKKYFVEGGGVRGNPGPQTISNWFNIQKFGSGSRDYKLVFCPTVCNFCKVICRDLGIFIHPQDGRRRLALSLSDDQIQSLPVFFKKA
ncbi:kunitz trypsin inhibitor 5-like [Andrographis paniculata]|uniref:kunitz trypsin inhibitor 5-like n=1 Tax=Andrographis paniculata TaxID=175694 RepID=UPI0021E95052|nr:kunitz trypsin inhibitor 5-like [Andrographis paniculata]